MEFDPIDLAKGAAEFGLTVLAKAAVASGQTDQGREAVEFAPTDRVKGAAATGQIDQVAVVIDRIVRIGPIGQIDRIGPAKEAAAIAGPTVQVAAAIGKNGEKSDGIRPCRVRTMGRAPFAMASRNSDVGSAESAR